MRSNLFKYLLIFIIGTIVTSCGSSSDNKSYSVLFTDRSASGVNYKLFELKSSNGQAKAVGESFYDEVDQGYDKEEPITVSHKGIVYFSASTTATGYELWQYDPRKPEAIGVNPKMVFDILPGTDDGFPYSFESLGELLYFQAESETAGDEFFIYDPRLPASSTNPLGIDLNPGISDSNPINIKSYNGKIYFRANLSGSGSEPWVYDPSEVINVGVNPKMLTDLNPGISSSSPYNFTVLKNKLYFSATSSAAGNELWVYDESEAVSASNPSQVLDINPGTSSSSPQVLTVSGDNLYFQANSPATGQELWKYNPDLAVSSSNPQVFDITSGTGSSRPNYILAYKSKLYFTARDQAGNDEFYIFNTNEAFSQGTNPLFIDLDPTSPNEAYPWQYTKCFSNKVCFSGENSVTGNYTFRLVDPSLSPSDTGFVKEVNAHDGYDAADIINYSF